MAQILLVFLVPITFIVHDLWTIEEDFPAFISYGGSASDKEQKEIVASRTVPTFPTEFDNEFVHFFKNVGMIGGLALFLTIEGDHLTEGDFI